MVRCGPGLFQALIQFASGSLTGLDCATLVILLRQHLSLNELFGGGPTDDTCTLGTRWPAATAERPTVRHNLNLTDAPRKKDRASRPFGVRAGLTVRAADMPIGSVLTLKIGSLFLLGIMRCETKREVNSFIEDFE